ncbi:MAG: DUF3047 domain-containing protein [Betaproteobacteria bacterium]|nr:DUF3047 domain-containing protein [Betaproteobacteria bacterium]
MASGANRVFLAGTRGSRLGLRALLIAARAGLELPYATLAYVWNTATLPGTVIPNNHTRRIQAIVVESGPANLNKWIDYERNLYEDYKRAFDEEPPPVGAVALMTDSDNTHGDVITFYGDIRLGRGAIQPPEIISR